MPLASPDFFSNLGLRQTVHLDFFDKFRPVHDAKYRISVLESQRLCDRIFANNSKMGKFAERVRDTRKKAKLSQKALAKLAGLSQTTISDIERGRNEGSRDILTLAKALKVSAEWLTTGITSGEHKPVSDSDEMLSNWAYLLPAQKQNILEQIRPLAAHNREVMEQLAPPEVITRTVNVAERRLANATSLPFADRRKKNDQ